MSHKWHSVLNTGRVDKVREVLRSLKAHRRKGKSMSIQVKHKGNFYTPNEVSCMFIALVYTAESHVTLDRAYEQTVRDLMLAGY